MKLLTTYYKLPTDRGFIALISVLVVGALVLVVSVGVASRSLSESQSSFAEQQSGRAFSLATLCAETALLKLQNVLDYSGSESILTGGNSCSILLIGGSGNINRTLKALSTVSGYTRKVQVEISEISPVMKIDLWEVVADF